MTPEQKQKRIAIAEACGWKHEESENSEGPCFKWTPPSNIPWKWDSWNYQPPDYLNDLNAMHDAEKVLKGSQWDEYERQLQTICGGCSSYEGAGKELIHATAAQRADAFIATLGLES